jgi:hypothetical protein
MPPLNAIRLCSWTETQASQQSFIETTKVFPEGAWVLVTVTHDASGATLYWDKEVVAQGAVPLASEMDRQFTIVGHSDWLKFGSDHGVRLHVMAG